MHFVYSFVLGQWQKSAAAIYRRNKKNSGYGINKGLATVALFALAASMNVSAVINFFFVNCNLPADMYVTSQIRTVNV